MTKPNPGTIMDNAAQTLATGEIPWDYCRRCREDLELSRQAWQSRGR
jgi:hypothetical protein